MARKSLFATLLGVAVLAVRARSPTRAASPHEGVQRAGQAR